MPTPRRYKDEAERKRAYRARKKAEAEAEAAKATGDVPEAPEPDDAPRSKVLDTVFAADPSRTVLEAIRDDPDAFNSDRIRAAQTLTRMDELAAINQPQTSDLVELRRTIEALPPGDRLAWLRGEVAEHRAAGAYANEGDA
jgi:hypothetical protein